MAEMDEEHGHEEEDHGEEGGMAHGIPEDAAALPNPIAATQDSVEAGAELYAANCAVCHGETGLGDGPSAAGLDPKPANLSEDHVQDLSDGALFYIINNGVEGTGMPAWKETLNDEQIWHLVNFARTFHEH
jgi:mono/diheme cytochrome c family protein